MGGNGIGGCDICSKGPEHDVIHSAGYCTLVKEASSYNLLAEVSALLFDAAYLTDTGSQRKGMIVVRSVCV